MLTKIKLKFHHIVFDFFSFIKKGNERSIKAKKNILAMLFLKGGNILVNIIRKSKFPPNPERSVQFSGKRTKRSVQKKGCTQHL